jgi:hypothetical protein
MADWRNDTLNDLKESGFVAVESSGILTDGDIRSAMEAINQSEAARNEDEELLHIKELKQNRSVRMYGS